MKINVVQNIGNFAKSNVKVSKAVEKSNMPILKQLNKDTVSFGMDGDTKVTEDNWAGMDVTFKTYETEYHPYLDEDTTDKKVGDVLSRHEEDNGGWGVGPSYQWEPVHQLVETTITKLGKRLPVTKEEAKHIPTNVLKSMAQRLDKKI